MTRAQVLFACVHNAGRSQMAAAFCRQLADPARLDVLSAGVEPAEHVHPAVVEVMREVGVDLADVQPHRLTDQMQRETTVLVTLGCGERCPLVPAARRLDWALDDPKAQPLERVRAIRDEIRRRVEQLVAERGWARAAS